ncbi:hypothetical protein MGG_01036 [Pyricularia oryzae 70-15]|uniref:Uncharacterized protein n=1 Tax=Pyricularia oryzae (strain 70-15 / ATCC MYA-4617 / FGSC 8958) TaxID=242507 RepID=G4NCS9_PYRO7|nr:uncharacterized protein MGG_01036 [Pyricularia oryzae 70-15]EHA48322.1 hypothetical protein MGG_01036 [Pyricularia oryzae 70-15]
MSDSSNYSATDIITFIGVPLAVLGVLPILYNTFVTLLALSKIKRILSSSRLTALTRSDVVNRVIEIELPRYAVTPWDRFRDRTEYWRLSRTPSAIPGGSWTTFNWRTNVIGLKVQRLEYADQLRQPQVEVAFDELVCYLLDLGAVPDPHGWKLLRTTGLWTPVGCALMKSPDRREKALSIAPLDDSDGMLSLSVAWDERWTSRNHSHLPPYWLELPPWPRTREKKHADDAGSDGNSEAEKPYSDTPQPGLEKDTASSLHCQDTSAHDHQPITCQITGEGLVSALTHTTTIDTDADDPRSLPIDHLRTSTSPTHGSAGDWFASAATAFGTTSQTVLWSYRTPPAIRRFARRDTIPCGVLVLLGLVDDAETPAWATASFSAEERQRAEDLDAMMRRGREQRAALAAEAAMPSAQQREAAVRERVRREGEQRLWELRERQRGQAERQEARLVEALASPRWGAERVAGLCLRWLGREDAEEEYKIGWVGEDAEEGKGCCVKGAVGRLLWRMVRDRGLAGRVCGLLDLWVAWADNGGMRKSDFRALEEDRVTFALAALVVALIADTEAAAEGTVSMDLQECIRMWTKVRLG